MARVKIEEIIEHLGSEMKSAMRAALANTAPDADVDANALYRAFVRAVGRKCSTWEQVPDSYVDKTRLHKTLHNRHKSLRRGKCIAKIDRKWREQKYREFLHTLVSQQIPSDDAMVKLHRA
jgi:hypothetical protein